MDARRIMGVMALGVRQGDVVTITVEGEDEDQAATALKHFLWEHF